MHGRIAEAPAGKAVKVGDDLERPGQRGVLEHDRRLLLGERRPQVQFAGVGVGRKGLTQPRQVGGPDPALEIGHFFRLTEEARRGQPFAFVVKNIVELAELLSVDKQLFRLHLQSFDRFPGTFDFPAVLLDDVPDPVISRRFGQDGFGKVNGAELELLEMLLDRLPVFFQKEEEENRLAFIFRDQLGPDSVLLHQDGKIVFPAERQRAQHDLDLVGRLEMGQRQFQAGQRPEEFHFFLQEAGVGEQVGAPGFDLLDLFQHGNIGEPEEIFPSFR